MPSFYSLVVAVAAERLIGIFFSQQDQLLALGQAVGVVREVAAFHADGMDFLDVFGDGQKGRHRAEGLSKVVRIQAGDDDADAPVREGLADFDEGLVEELGLVDADDADVICDFQHLRRVGNRLGADAVEVVGDDVLGRIAVVDGRLEDGDFLVRELGPAEPADQLLGLAGEHRTADDFDAPGFMSVF